MNKTRIALKVLQSKSARRVTVKALKSEKVRRVVVKQVSRRLLGK